MAKIWDFSNYYPIKKVVITPIVVIVTLFGLLQGFLFVTNQDLVLKDSYILNKEIKDSYILKKETVSPNILRDEAIREIEKLIIIGENLGNDIAKTNVWLLQVLVFIHAIELKQDFTWQIDPLKGQKMSAVEADLRWVLLNPSVEVQAQKTLGILKGLKSAFQIRI